MLCGQISGVQQKGINTADLNVNSDKIEHVKGISPNNVTADITRVNNSRDRKLDDFGVYEVFNLKLGNYTRAEITFTENETWGQNFIDDNPRLYNGPGHHYDSGLIQILRGENLESINAYHNNSSFKSTLHESGTYYIVIAPTSITAQRYIDNDGDCHLFYDYTGDSELRRVESCDHEDVQKNTLLIISSLIAIAFSYFLYRYLKRKIIVRKLNSTLKGFTNDKEVDQEKLEKLYHAMEKANSGEYKQASKILNQVRE